MDMDSLNKWLTLVTNIAVVAGIFLLVVELRQNQESMAMEAQRAALESSHLDVSRFTDWRAKFINDPETTELFLSGVAGEELSEADKFRFDAICNDLFWAAALMHERSTTLGRLTYENATVEWMRQTLGIPSIESCWRDMRDMFKLWGYSEFVDAVERDR